ncbi:DUF4145 domain-containing protein [Agreia bicolorata]|uniref:DUF4145 domain-containing protein n=1 Tax=Agreia bicolorata TaxID=110935 RepID=A0ABR5CHS4_9MICO|nr:DUF4145 domain-containing protein [Agreia bicolorata]KJC65195.1 hypothetical protein TZ00_06660 [Agreia bicolorata]
MEVFYKAFGASHHVYDTQHSMGFDGDWTMSRCESCNQMSVWRNDVLMYPSASLIPPPANDMPANAAVLYEEARQVLPHSRRAGAALGRATLERLLRTLDPEAGKTQLDERIARMESRVSSSLWELLTVLRHVGNKAVHVDDEADGLVAIYLDDGGTELAEAMFEAINELVDELVTKPKRVRGFFEKLPDGVRESALSKLPSNKQ